MQPSVASAVHARHAVTVQGSGEPTLVLVHGLGCDQHIWRALAPRFAADHRVVTFDLMGVGHSERTQYDPKRHATLEGYAQDLIDVVRSLDGPPPVVIGHSLGGTIALLATSIDPTYAAKLVAIVVSPRYLDEPPHYRGGMTPADVRDVLATMDQNFVGWAGAFSSVVAPQSDAARTMHDALTSSDPFTTRHLAELVFSFDLRPLLPGVALETLVLRSQNDPIIPPEASEHLSRSLPRARSVTLPVPGHCPHISHPQLVEAAVRAFLAER